MKRSALLAVCALALGACSTFKTTMAPPAAAVAAVAAVGVVPAGPAPQQLVDRNGTAIERIAFKPGVSSVTVEKLGKQQACTSDEGAGLVTAPGPVEVYRIMCSSGKVFMARCELRQCRAM